MSHFEVYSKRQQMDTLREVCVTDGVALSFD